MKHSASALIMAGGTGGHVIPALSAASKLKSQGYKVSWLGSTKGIENELVEDAGYTLHKISVTGLRGKGILKWIFSPFLLLRACIQAWAVISRVKPKMALGMGGFASGPGGLICVLRGIPLVVHEQNAVPGMTNYCLSKLTKYVLQAFDGTFSKNGVVTVGNPVRENIYQIKSPAQRILNRTGRLNILVLGGSLGAVAINEKVIEMMSLMQKEERPNIWHQAGKRNLDQVKHGYEEKSVDAKVSAFIADMAQAYEWADLVICRSGALTVSELASAGVAAILVPFPYAVDDHQTANANYLVKEGAAWLRPQSEVTAESLYSDVKFLQSDRQKVVNMSEAARRQAKPESAALVAKVCIEAAHG